LSDRKPYHILISPIGEFEQAIVDAVSKTVQECFGIPTKTCTLLNDIGFAKDNERSQYHSTSILKELEAAAPQNSVKIAALCRVDLFIPILTYVYGEAQLDGKACIVSTHRLHEGTDISLNNDVFFERITKEIIHELGHTFNLRHCQEPTCLMHYCRNEKDVDRKSNQLCRYCTVLLNDSLKSLYET
jgi:archaemetzincin